MKPVLKHIVGKTYKPLLVRYLSKIRQYHQGDIRLEIPPEVFHPAFFFSTQLLLQYIEGISLQGKRFLELGAGSGLISIYAAKKGAIVTATDINPIAIECLQKNSRKNRQSLIIIESDLFLNIPIQSFDIIAINPPYYKKQPQTFKDYAWCCGENGEYFENLFADVGDYMHDNTGCYMVLFDGCDMNMICSKAAHYGYHLQCVHSAKNILEENFIFAITKTL
ncbi:methyltransferase [Terrimonas alba]|uniref:methyltransferase n=1 Tax=Terrimonas alba TaxID=3349636 RepID=UPI0035F3B0E5